MADEYLVRSHLTKWCANSSIQAQLPFWKFQWTHWIHWTQHWPSEQS